MAALRTLSVTFLSTFASSLLLQLHAILYAQILDAPLKYSEVNVHPKHNKTASRQHNLIFSQ
jgi:hypothetical protein